MFHFYAQTPEQPDGALLHRTGLVRMLKDSSRLSAGVFGKGFAINEVCPLLGSCLSLCVIIV